MMVFAFLTLRRHVSLLIALLAAPLPEALAGEAAGSATSAAPVPAVIGCSDFAVFDLTGIGGAGSRITATKQTTERGVPTCIVQGQLAPSIRFEVSLPIETWSGRFLQLGCGGLCGNVSRRVGAASGCMPVETGGFVTAGTDMGHEGMGGAFGSDPRKRQDFADRGVHLTALTAKALIHTFYGHGPDRSYFSGCSDGGREALIEAQRFPEDFDGIIAGAPALNFQVQNGLYHAWMARSNTGADGRAIITAARLPMIHRAVLAQCDGLDGSVDGLIADPRACRFDPGTLLCGVASAPADCLSSTEVEALRRFYDGPRDPQSGERLIVGGPQPGSELAWAGVFVPSDAYAPIFSTMIALDALRNLSFETNPPATFALADMTFDRATFDRLRPLHPLYDATNPDLSAFERRGGRLILWHGWADPHISPLNTVAYHEAVRTTMGGERAEAFERLYLIPGLHHCSGGEGPSTLDLLTPMIEWVEHAVAPDAIMARPASEARTDDRDFGSPVGGPPMGAPLGSALKSVLGGSALPAPPFAGPMGGAAGPVPESAEHARPVYPYPSVALSKPGADPRDATGFHPGTVPGASAVPAWAGADFFRPYTLIRLP